MTYVHTPQCDCDECHPLQHCPCGRVSVHENGDCDLCAVGKHVDAIERAATAGYTLTNVMWLCAAVRKLSGTICELERRHAEQREQFASSSTERDDVLEEAARLVEREIERIKKLPEYDVPDEVPWQRLLRNRLEYVERCLPTAIRVMRRTC